MKNILLMILVASFLIYGMAKAEKALNESQLGPGDADRGRQLLIDHSFGQGGNVYAMAPSEFNNLYLVWPGDISKQAAAASPVERRKMIREYYGLFLALGKTDADLDTPPMGFVASKDGKVWEGACLLCHAGAVKTLSGGVLSDEVKIGIGNNRLDLTSLLDDRYALSERFPKVSPLPLERGENFKSLMKKYRSSLVSDSRGSVNIERGVAINLYMRKEGSLKLDPARVAKALVGIDADIGPVADVDTPPWWNTREKSHFYSSGLVPNAAKSMATSFLTIGNNPWDWYLKYTPDLFAFVNSVEPPPYIFSIDATKAARGKTLFENTCSKCHGTYENPAKPNFETHYLTVDAVGTDPAGSMPWGREMRQRWANSWLGDYGKADVNVDPKGYIATPLKGIWATAPYLHNGSVPTLKALLMIDKGSDGKWVDVTSRPTQWKAHYEAYDQDGMGPEIEVGPIPSRLSAHDQRMWFDSTDTKNGKANTGHIGPKFFTFGPENRLLTPDEKSLIIEYLKTL